MKFIKQYWLVLSIFLLVLLLVLIRTLSNHNFRYDAVKWAEPSALGSNMLTEDLISALGGKILLVDLGCAAAVSEHFKAERLLTEPESVLEKANLALIRKNEGPVILCCDDTSVSARVWMVLSEMGMKNIYVLAATSADNIAK